jgi:hypothetical protein
MSLPDRLLSPTLVFPRCSKIAAYARYLCEKVFPANKKTARRRSLGTPRMYRRGLGAIPFRDFPETKISSEGGNVFKARGVYMCSWSESPRTKAGGSNDQISDQVCDAGNGPDGADRCAVNYSGFCGIRWRRSPCWLAAPGPAAFAAFVVPEAVGHQSHPQNQEGYQAFQHLIGLTVNFN